MIGESAQQKKYKVVSLENPIVKVLLHERYSVALLRAVVVGMFKAFSYKGSSCSKVSILVSRYMLFKHCTSERCPMMYAPAGSVIDFVPRFHEFMTETLYVSSELQYCFPRSLFKRITEFENTEPKGSLFIYQKKKEREKNMDKMILKDNTTIELQTGASLSAVTAKFDSKDAMLVAWKTLTPENLAEVKFQNDAGMTVGTYTDLVLEFETSQEVSDGIQTTFSFRMKTGTEKRLDALEEGQTVQDEAISDLGAATSELAEKEGVE